MPALCLTCVRWACRAILATACLVAFSSCSEKSGSSGRSGRGGPNAGAAAPVLIGRVQRKIVPLVIDGIGTVEPIRSASVRAQITGTLLKIDIREGQDVAGGDLLFEIDPAPFESALRSALADQRRITVQRDSALAQLARYRGLNVGTMVSQDQFQQIQDNARALEAQAAAVDAAVATARLQLAYCSIRAPIAGRTGNLNVHEGDLIRANDAGPLVTINQLSPIYVTFGIAQQQLPALLRYRGDGSLKVEAPANSPEQRAVQGELTFVDNTVDPTTGTIRLKATFSNEDHRLWPGQFSSVLVTLASPEVLTVPASAIQNDQTGQHVFVVRPDRTAEFRTVTIERTHEEDAVVLAGLNAGDTVVTDGQLRVVPGGPVTVRPADTLNTPDAAVNDVVEQGAAHPRGKDRKQGT